MTANTVPPYAGQEPGPTITVTLTIRALAHWLTSDTQDRNGWEPSPDGWGDEPTKEDVASVVTDLIEGTAYDRAYDDPELFDRMTALLAGLAEGQTSEEER